MHQIQNLYVYVKKEIIDQCCKYGMKLSSFCNTNLKVNNINKKCILAYLSPKDSDKYNDNSYDILRIKLNKINSYVINEDNTDELCKIEKYTIGDYSNPTALINSSIMPENIFKYNRNIDIPLIIQNSKEFYLDRLKEKEIEIESSKYTFDDLRKTN